jgi:uncharacterized protein (TIGR02444 family)
MLDTPLWTFSLAVYGRPGVATECLDLQEKFGLDVNLLLFAAFIGAVEGVRLGSADIAAANAEIANWHKEIVRPLRSVRRALKPLNADALRTQVKTAELDAEKFEQSILWDWSRRQLAHWPRSDQALAANLNAVLVFYRAGSAATPSLLDAASIFGSQTR